MPRDTLGQPLVIGLLILVLFTYAPTLPSAQAQTRAGALTLDPSDGRLDYAVIDSDNGFAYFGASGVDKAPDRIVKIDLSTFTRSSALLLDKDEALWGDNALIDSGKGFAYFPTTKYTSNLLPAALLKIDLVGFKQAGKLTVSTNSGWIFSTEIDPKAGYAYVATLGAQNKVWKVKLADFTISGSITLRDDEGVADSIMIDSANGYGYFACDPAGSKKVPDVLVKVHLSNLTRAGVLRLNEGDEDLYVHLIDSENGFAYFASSTEPAQLVKIRLADFSRVDALSLAEGEGEVTSGVIDRQRGFVYLGTSSRPAIVAVIDLKTFTRVETMKLNEGENELTSGIIDSENGFAYFGTHTEPGIIVKVALMRPVTTTTSTPIGETTEQTASPAETRLTTVSEMNQALFSAFTLPTYYYGAAVAAALGCIIASLILYRRRRGAPAKEK